MGASRRAYRRGVQGLGTITNKVKLGYGNSPLLVRHVTLTFTLRGMSEHVTRKLSMSSTKCPVPVLTSECTGTVPIEGDLSHSRELESTKSMGLGLVFGLVGRATRSEIPDS